MSCKRPGPRSHPAQANAHRHRRHQIYFEKIHPSVPMIHKYRYLAAMNLYVSHSSPSEQATDNSKAPPTSDHQSVFGMPCGRWHVQSQKSIWI